MTEKRLMVVTPTNRQHIKQQIDLLKIGDQVRVGPPTRNLEQNAALWAMLGDVSEQVIWHGRKLDSESWKHVFSSSLSKQDVVPNLDGTGFVVMGISTSKMTKGQMSDLLELISAFGAERNVRWSQ